MKVKLSTMMKNDEQIPAADSGKQPAKPVPSDHPSPAPRLTIDDFFSDENRNVPEGEYWTDGPVGDEII